jgi:hypothetical protein
MDGAIEQFGKFGLDGLVIFALFALIWFLVREHGAERLLWRDSYDKNTEIMRTLSAQFESRK